MGHQNMDTLIYKALDHFNTQMQVDNKGLRFNNAPDAKESFHIRMSKRKNGKPNTDFPSKRITNYVTLQSSAWARQWAIQAPRNSAFAIRAMGFRWQTPV